MDLNQVSIPCNDYDESVRFYQTLGLRQIVDSPPHYARFETDSGSTLSIHSADLPIRPSSTIVYFEVDDIDAEVRKFRRLGIVFETEPTDQRWLWREARLRDPAGNRICLFHAGDNRRFPPWRVDGRTK